MTEEKAFAVVDRLSLLKFFPAGESARIELANLIMEVCRNERHADDVADDVLRKYDEWPGPSTLRYVASCRPVTPEFVPAPTHRPQGEWLEQEESCDACDSLGHVLRDGHRVRCACKYGQELPQKVLDALGIMAGKQHRCSERDKMRSAKRITELLQ